MKYLKTWMGKSGGSLGDSGGYPERRFEIIESLDQLVKTYKEDATYYELKEVDLHETVKAVKNLTGD